MWPTVLVTLGTFAGLGLRRWLGRRGYRYADEADLPRRSLTWVLPVTILLTLTVGAAVLPGRHPVVGATTLAAAWLLVAISAIDVDVHRIPDAVTFPAYPITMGCLAVCSWATGDWPALGRALAGGAALLLSYLLLALLAPRRQVFGLGDVKLGGLLGMVLAWFGWTPLLVGTYLAFLTGGVVALALLATRRASRGSRIAFGPFLSLGAVLALVVA